MELQVSRPGLVTPVGIDPAGRTGPTPGQARGPRWRRVGPNAHVPSGTPDTVPQRIVDAVGSMPPGSAATGWAALHWLGARWFDGLGPDGTPLPVPVAVGDRHIARQRDGLAVSEDWLFDEDVIVVDGLPITRSVRSVTYEARVAADDIAAVRAIDMAVYDDLVSLAEVRNYTTRLISRPGKRRLERAIDLADENAWSPMEVVMRLLWQSHRDVPLLCNRPVFDASGSHVFTPDLLDLAAGVAGEYDGSVHDSGLRRSRDLTRQEMARRLGIEVVTMMSGPGEMRRFHDRLDGAYARAGRAGPRQWTVEQPPWWVDTSTVARRRSLGAADRERWLRHRRTGQNGRESA